MQYNIGLIRRILIVLVVMLGTQSLAALSAERDSLIVSLITCNPGRQVYELCGHMAIRIRNQQMDSVWNYGIYDFNKPNFIYRFVKGETDYVLAGYPFQWFMPEYIAGGRKVVEQELNLNQREARKLLAKLQWECRPENRVYRYNYVKDNCATRPIQRLDSVVNLRINYPELKAATTFREEMRRYHKNYPWYQFGIDLALGSGIDRPITSREAMFAPVDAVAKIDSAKFENGRQLVAKVNILNPDSGMAQLPPTPWYASPLFCCWWFFVMVALLCWFQWSQRRILKGAYFLWFALCGLAGCVISFLVFVSTHEATSPNFLLIWLNPLQLVFAVSVVKKSWRGLARFLAWTETAVMIILLGVWYFLPQSANPAFFPLMGATLLLALEYGILTIPRKKKARYRIKEVKNPRRVTNRR